ncbi:hypothetical protein B9Z55_009214 [Caenorhabditis nigoni]|uniref:Uncharacterized protein n=1 Tax=Caenorhabditis nigoni TaxID=1611254 RepID=A0A2G5UR38_9PELO|nr:hypothetical protein B9Z55_009214 [Caenorhabditis nigoni]
MSKQSSTILEEINEEAKKQAITWQVKARTDKANRELQRPKKIPPPKCHFCEGAHYSWVCGPISKIAYFVDIDDPQDEIDTSNLFPIDTLSVDS